MTPSARAYLDAYGIPADSIEGREIAEAFAAHEHPSNVIHLPMITSAKLEAHRARTAAYLPPVAAEGAEASTSRVSAPYPFKRVMQFAALAGLVVALIAAALTPGIHALNRQAQAYEWERV